MYYELLIIGGDPLTQLEPYDIGLKKERYIAHTKESLIRAHKQNFISKLNEVQEKNLEYINKDFRLHTSHYNSDNMIHDLYNVLQEVIKELKRTDEDIYNEESGWYEPQNIGPDWEVYSTNNPKGKWDSYALCTKENSLFKRDPEKYPDCTWVSVWQKWEIKNLDDIKFGAVLKDFKWHDSQGKTRKEWDAQIQELLWDTPKDTRLYLYTCHV